MAGEEHTRVLDPERDAAALKAVTHPVVPGHDGAATHEDAS